MKYVGIFFYHLVYFVAIWYIFPVLVYYTKKNLATLVGRCRMMSEDVARH
jgi:hypothetical protein